MKSAPAVLLAGGDSPLRSAARDVLHARGLEALEAANADAAEAIARSRPLDAVVVAEPLPDTDALGLLARLVALESPVPVVVVAPTEDAARAVEAGAAHGLTANELPALSSVVERLIEEARQRRREAAREGIAIERWPFLGESDAVRRLESEARRTLQTGHHVLIEGEPGVGKRWLARWLHRHGPRGDEAFVECRVASPSSAELFGNGAAKSDPRRGLLELADRGTLYIHDIADLEADAQARLQDAIEKRRIERPGSAGDRFVDVQLVAGTRQDLAAAVREGRFRADLHDRIAANTLFIPALRERPEDIPLIAAALLAELRIEMGNPHAPPLSFETCAALSAYPWPNNARELRNVLEWSLLCAEQDEVRGPHLGLAAAPDAAASDLSLTLSQVEQRHIERVLMSEGGHVERAAKRLDVPRSTLYQRIKALGIRPRFRG